MRDSAKNPRVCVSSIGGKLNSHLVNGGAIYQAVLSSFLGKWKIFSWRGMSILSCSGDRAAKMLQGVLEGGATKLILALNLQ